MGRNFSLLTVLLLLSMVELLLAQPNLKLVNNGARDNGKYVLRINQDKIRLTGYYAPYHAKGNFAIIPLKFTNKSADTLRYSTFSCLWTDIYKVSNGNMEVFKWPCEKNVDKVIQVLPNEITVINLPINITGSVKKCRQKFKIGMHLVRANGWSTDLFQLDAALKDEKNIIWSNEVEMPSINIR